MFTSNYLSVHSFLFSLQEFCLVYTFHNYLSHPKDGEGNVLTCICVSVHREDLPWPMGVPTLADGGGYLTWMGIPTLEGGYLPQPGGTYPGYGVPTLDRRYLPQLGGTHLDGVPPGQDWMGEPPTLEDRMGITPPPPGRDSRGVLDTQWAVCLLHSHKRTSLFYSNCNIRQII